MPVFAGDWVLPNDGGEWIPKEEWLAANGMGRVPRPYIYTPPKYEPTVYMPFEGFDAKRFPNTYITLLMLYHQPDWWRGTWRQNGYRDFIRNPYKGINYDGEKAP